MKKRWIAIGAIAGALLITMMALAIAVIFRKDFFQKTKYDHIDDTVYNNTAVVGEDGLFYLVRDGKKVSRGFSWIKSVNDYYENLDEVLRQPDSDLVLFDYYLAKDEGHSNYMLITPDGDELTIMGDGLTLERVALPYVIFTNHATSRQAVLSLQALDSDFSSRSSEELTLLQTFSSVTPLQYDSDSALYSHLQTENTVDTKPQRIYNAKGKELLRAEAITPVSFGDETNPVLYWLDTEANALYDDQGTQCSEGPADPVFSADRAWAYQLSTPTAEGAKPYITVFSQNGAHVLSDDAYELSSCVMLGNCLSVTAKGKDGVTLIRPKSATQVPYQTLTLLSENVIAATVKDSTDTVYLNADGMELLRSPYSDMTVDAALSSAECTVFRSAAFDAANGGAAYLHFTAPDKKAVSATLAANQTLSRFAPDIPDALQRTFLITETVENASPLFRLYTPFATTQTGETLDRAPDLYSQGGVYWCLGVSYSRGVYEILDPVCNHVAYSLSVKPEDFARLSFAYEQDGCLATSPFDGESGVPIVILCLSRYEEKLNTVTQTRYLALYRQASVGDPLFDGKTLRCQEIGQNPVRDSAVTFYTKENYLVVHTASGSRTLRMNDGLELIEANSLSYEISGILTDAEDSTKQYLRIHIPDSQTVGLADSEGNVILSPYYDGIYHAENNRFIVRLRNAFGVISYQNGKVKELIDCQYSQLFPLGDGGYIGIDGNGHSHVYEKSRLLYDDALSYAGSGYPYEEIRVLQLDNESRPVVGYGTVINRDGKLYLHMPSAFSRQTQTSFSTKSSVLPDTVRNDIAKLICYYDASGTLVETKVVLPTSAGRAAFVADFAAKQETWYLSPLAQKQSAPVSAEDILNATSPAVKLYPKAS